MMPLPEDLNPVDLFPSLGESAEAPNEFGLTDTVVLNHQIKRSSSFSFVLFFYPHMTVHHNTFLCNKTN